MMVNMMVVQAASRSELTSEVRAETGPISERGGRAATHHHDSQADGQQHHRTSGPAAGVSAAGAAKGADTAADAADNRVTQCRRHAAASVTRRYAACVKSVKPRLKARASN